MRFATLLLAAAVLPAFVGAHAQIIDQNYNGIDDVWEAVYNAGSLAPNVDTDGDGFTNAQEAAAGTDPRNASSHPPTLTISAAAGRITLTWNTVPGKQYRLQTSTATGPAAIWTYLGAPYYGAGSSLNATFGVDASKPHFYRVEVGDVDSDGDGVSDWAELRLGYDPFNADTFNSGLGDRQAIVNALSSLNDITLTAEHAVASTAYGDVGVLTFTRAGNFTALNVAYTVGGTAVAGKDYAVLSGHVIFPEAVNTVRVNVTPLAGATIAASKTVIVKLAGMGYQIDPDVNTATVTITPQPAAAGQVVDESWDGLDTWSLDGVPFDSTPTRRSVLTTLEAGTNTGFNEYGSRVRGYITAPTTGTYTFWVAADDIGEFRLSTNDQMANLVLRASTENWTNSREWNKYGSQKSPGIALKAGQRYAFEMKFFQGYGGDNLAVGWLKPGETGTVPSEVVPGSVLSSYVAPYSPPGLTTLYFGTLNRLSGAPVSAQGFASLRLSVENSVAIVSFANSGLSGVPTSLSLHGPANPGQTGALIQEFVKATPQTDGSYVWKIGNPANVTYIQNGQVYASIATAAHPAGEIAGQLLRSTGTGTFTPPAAPPALPTTAPTSSDAARLMTQATFGANSTGIAAIQRDGFAAWIDDQLNSPPTLTAPFINSFASSGQSVSTDTFQESWWKNAITAPDQLRQRVAFALSEIMVVSDIDGNLGGSPAGLAAYYDTLLTDAFGNYRTLLEDVTLHPVMGDYLNMLHNDKANPTTGTVPNENYGREAMQLMSIGLEKLNPDGSLLLDSNSLPIPTYGQEEVEGFSHVYTGWNFAQTGALGWDYVSQNYRQPMMLVPEHHDQNAKHLLDGVVLPAGQSGAQDLKDALDMLANHPNAGPFICRQLIQKLVTSNPSPAYIYRAAQVFANNGQGVRGDLRAVIRAILLDYEARSINMVNNTHYGKEREPVIRVANMYRAFNGHAYNGRFEIDEYDISQNFGQAVLDAPSVFNFFSPSYTLTGEIAEAGLVCPEFGITTATTVVFSSNELRARIAETISASYPSQMGIDLTSYRALASNPTALVNSLNLLLLNGHMSSGLQTQAVNAVTGVDATNTLGRAQTAVQILCTSPEFCIQK